MFARIFDTTNLLEVALRTFLVYFTLLFLLRLAGKREVGQMTLFDLVTILIISNAVQNAMVGPDTSLLGGLVAATVILLLNFTVGAIRGRSKRAEQLFEGSPSLIVHDGEFIRDHMKHEHLSEDDVLQAMREHGVDDLKEVKTAVLEVDGSISIIQKQGEGTAMVAKRTRRRFRRQKRV